MKTLASALICLYILSGCATQAQKEANRILKQGTITKDNFISCRNKTVTNTLVYKRLDKIFIMDSDKELNKIPKLAINRYITEQESQDLLEYAALSNNCKKRFIDDFTKVQPDLALVFTEAFAESDAYVVQLINKQITIGEANQKSIDMANNAKRRLSEVAQSLENKLEYSHQNEMTQRQRFNEAVQRWSYQQQLLNTLRRY